MPELISIRAATFADIPLLLPLMEQLGYPTTASTLAARFEAFFRQPGYGIAVACFGAEGVGFIAWSRSLLFVSDTPRIHIEALVVDAHHRGLGIGKQLILFVENVAYSCAPCIIDLTSGLRRAPEGTHAFYQKLGYKNEGDRAKIYLRKEIF